jgi:hypothetical protein
MSLNELPGAELILPGLDDLHRGETNTVGSLLVAIAATRLTEAGLDVPKDQLAPEPELTLYARLQDERDDAYLYYNALLNSLNSFCNALELSYKSRTSPFKVCYFHVAFDPQDLDASLGMGEGGERRSPPSPTLGYDYHFH